MVEEELQVLLSQLLPWCCRRRVETKLQSSPQDMEFKRCVCQNFTAIPSVRFRKSTFAVLSPIPSTSFCSCKEAHPPGLPDGLEFSFRDESIFPRLMEQHMEAKSACWVWVPWVRFHLAFVCWISSSYDPYLHSNYLLSYCIELIHVKMNIILIKQ